MHVEFAMAVLSVWDVLIPMLVILIRPPGFKEHVHIYPQILRTIVMEIALPGLTVREIAVVTLHLTPVKSVMETARRVFHL
jgi:hypothetical protein